MEVVLTIEYIHEGPLMEQVLTQIQPKSKEGERRSPYPPVPPPLTHWASRAIFTFVRVKVINGFSAKQGVQSVLGNDIYLTRNKKFVIDVARFVKVSQFKIYNNQRAMNWLKSRTSSSIILTRKIANGSHDFYFIFQSMASRASSIRTNTSKV